MIAETKIDDCFLASEFEISDFTKPFGVDWNQKGDETMLYIRVDIPAKLLSIDKRIRSCLVTLNSVQSVQSDFSTIHITPIEITFLLTLIGFIFFQI